MTLKIPNKYLWILHKAYFYQNVDTKLVPKRIRKRSLYEFTEFREQWRTWGNFLDVSAEITRKLTRRKDVVASAWHLTQEQDWSDKYTGPSKGSREGVDIRMVGPESQARQI